jgi:myo-inositol-1(or 4)-monophosphatase
MRISILASSINWLNVLSDAAETIYHNVTEARLKNSMLEMRELKKVLDAVAQNSLIQSLTKNNISVDLVSEEGNLSIGGGGTMLIADPIDGTTNFSRNLVPAMTCLAVSKNNFFSGITLAIVMDLYTGEIFKAEKGKGSTLDDKKIYVNNYSRINNSLISIDMSKNPKFNRFTKLFNNARYIRMLGSSAADICYISSGVFDAHVDIRGSARATDLAAALFILQEAGGYFCLDSDDNIDMVLGRENTYEIIAASNKPLLDEIKKLTNDE